MKVGVISDSHDNIWMLARAMESLKNVDVILHCGDIVAPFMIVRLGETLPNVPIHIVWGNNDGDKVLLQQKASHYDKITVHGDFAEIEIDGWNFAMNHYPAIAQRLAKTGLYQVVCYGHDHTLHHEWIGQTLLLNPGELMGLNGRSTVAIVDTEDFSVKVVDLNQSST